MNDSYTIKYPRRRLARGLVRVLGKAILPIAFRLKVRGKENFPQKGAAILVGNHVAVMEAVLMAVVPPRQVEFLGSAEIPHERITQRAIDFYGDIPLHRGFVDRPAMRKALEVLAQGGVIGIFPEGGTWDPGKMRPQTGVAWLSYHANAPVLPIGFGGMLGALDKALKLRRPELIMNIGQLIEPIKIKPGVARKVQYEAYARQIMQAVYELIPEEEQQRESTITEERFELTIDVLHDDGKPVTSVHGIEITYPESLAKFFHRPVILKVFRENLKLPTEVLERLHEVQDAGQIYRALTHVLNYLDKQNPYFLSYRFGAKEAKEMQTSLRELAEIAQWAYQYHYLLSIRPVRIYVDSQKGIEERQVIQGVFEDWM